MTVVKEMVVYLQERTAQKGDTFFYFQSSAPTREGQQTEKHGSPSILRSTDNSYMGYFQNQ
jgi:hypothetical protein